MKIIYNKILPFKGFKAMALWPFVFVRSEYKGRLSWQDLRHEQIHLAQQRELLVFPMLLFYGIEWGLKLWKGPRSAYYRVSFEREAYRNESVPGYLDTRRFWAWLKYL